MTITLRDVTPEDEALVREIYAWTRAHELRRFRGATNSDHGSGNYDTHKESKAGQEKEAVVEKKRWDAGLRLDPRVSFSGLAKILLAIHTSCD